MVAWSDLVAPAIVLALCVVGGLLYAWLSDVRAWRSVAAVERGRAVSVPMLVTANGDQRRGHAVLDGDTVRVLGKGVNVVVGRRAYETAAVRRGRADVELMEYADQRAFSDGAGVRYLLGPLEEWEPAFTAALQREPRRAGRLRLLVAALPRTVLVPLALSVLSLLAFHVIWAAGHDVQARMVEVVVDDGVESCGVRWHEEGRDEYAELDCYEPFPEPGTAVTVRALAWPFDESAMDHEDTYDVVTLLFGTVAALLAFSAGVVAVSRLRRPPVPLSPLAGPPVTHVLAPGATSVPTTVELRDDAPLPTLLDAVASREGWDDPEAAHPPDQPWHTPYVMAFGAGRWWPGVAMAAPALLLEGLSRPLRAALLAGAAAVVLWAAFRAVTAWLVIRRAYAGPVTSEWEYRLVRTVDDDWLALLFLGTNPHWMVLLAGPGHPAPTGRCGVRGDLEDGGAIHIQVAGSFWPTMSPVVRVDEELVEAIRDDLLDRLTPPEPGIQ